MIFKVKNDELTQWLTEKDKLVHEGRSLSKQIDELEEKRNTCGMQIQKLKDKIIPLAEELVKPHLSEWGMLTTINIDGDEVALEYIDQVEEFIKALKEKQLKESEDSAN